MTETLDQFLDRRETLFGDPDAPPALRLQSFFGKTDPHFRNGIDGARYQQHPDFDEVRELGGVSWCPWKATEGRGYIDPTFAANRAAMAGKIRYRGAYHWPKPGNDPGREVAHVIRTVGPLDVGEFVMVDAEEAGLTEEDTYETGDRLRQHYQRPVAIYSGRFVDGGRIINSDRVRALGPFVLAAYTTYARAVALAGPRGFDAWQFLGGAGRCPGVSPLAPNLPCDNDWIPDLSAFDAAAGFTTTPPTDPEPDTMRYILITLTDSDAKFIATQDARGRIFHAEWSGPGADPRVAARLKFFDADERVELNTAALWLITLSGPLPFGDTRHDWTGAEFARVV